MFRHAALIALLPFVVISVGACASETMEEDESETGVDALSQAECNRIVPAEVEKSKVECGKKATAADQKRSERLGLERGVGTAYDAFVAKLERYAGSGVAEVSETIRECSAVQCSGELQRDDVKADCSIEQAFLKGACYVRNLPQLRAAAADLNIDTEATQLQRAVGALTSGWASLAVQETWLRAQHVTCRNYTGSGAQRTKLYATCRASCNEDDATSVTSINEGHRSACSPVGYEEVKDDLGNVVECGRLVRPWYTAATICECKADAACTQFAAVAGSSERGKTCATGKTKKLVWSKTEMTAKLECR